MEDGREDQACYGVFSPACIDEHGHSYTGLGGNGSRALADPGSMDFRVTYDYDRGLEGRLYLTISRYPAGLEEDFRVKIR